MADWLLLAVLFPQAIDRAYEGNSTKLPLSVKQDGRKARNLPNRPTNKHRWRTYGKEKVIRIHWRLAPKSAVGHVVAHEFVHLLHRNHSPEFWRKLETMPEWELGKEMLERWEVEHRAV